MTSENIPFAENVKIPSDECEEAFFALYPDFFYTGSTALTLWIQGWQAAVDWKEAQEDNKPRIQLI
jgi:hypothetical protein